MLLYNHNSALFSGSTVSLAMGLTFGGLSAFGAYQVSQNPANFYVLLGMFPLRVSFLPSRQVYNRDFYFNRYQK